MDNYGTFMEIDKKKGLMEPIEFGLKKGIEWTVMIQ